MKIACCWMYALEISNYPPSMRDTYAALERMAKAGFTYIEMEAFDLKGKGNIEELRSEKRNLKKFADDLGLKIVSFPIMLLGLTDLDDKERARCLELFDRSLEVGVYLGSEMVSVCTFNPSLQFVEGAPYEQTLTFDKQFRIVVDPDFSWKKQWDVLVNTLSICNEKLKKAGVKMVVEPRVGEIISNTDIMLRLIDEIEDENFGAILEVPHLHAQKEILPLSVEKLGRKIQYIHAADNDSSNNAHNKVGDGTVDWEGILTTLKKYNFNGYAAIDVRPIDVNNIDMEYIESRQFLEKLARKIDL